MASHNGGRSPKDLHHLLSAARQVFIKVQKLMFVPESLYQGAYIYRRPGLYICHVALDPMEKNVFLERF